MCKLLYVELVMVSLWDLYATAAAAMRWQIAIHLCVFACVRACVCVCYIDYIVNLTKSSCEKPLVQFQPNLAGLILG
jgi:hypothetical protein